MSAVSGRPQPEVTLFGLAFEAASGDRAALGEAEWGERGDIEGCRPAVEQQFSDQRASDWRMHDAVAGEAGRDDETVISGNGAEQRFWQPHLGAAFLEQPGEARATFLLRLIEGGALSEWMRGQQEPGASLLVAGPFGRFFLRDAEQPLVFVAGGTGIGPTISMIEHMKARGVMPPSLKLVFGVNTLASLFYRERLAELIADFPNSELVVAVVKPEGTWDGVVGTAVDGLKAIALAPGSHIYLCGPPIMTEHAQNHLRSQGIAERAVFAEAFLPTLDAKAA